MRFVDLTLELILIFFRDIKMKEVIATCLYLVTRINKGNSPCFLFLSVRSIIFIFALTLVAGGLAG